MTDTAIVEQIIQLKSQINTLQEKLQFSWIYPLIGVVLGSIISFLAHYFVFRWNKKKEDRRYLIQTIARITGICRRYGDSAVGVEESRIWQGYIVNSINLGIDPPMSLEKWLDNERDALNAYQNARSEFEEALTEYIGITGFKDEKITKLIIQLRQSGLGEIIYDSAKTKEEFQQIKISELVQKRMSHHVNEETSLNRILSEISIQLRFTITP